MCFGGRERVRERYINWSVSPKVNEVHLFKCRREGGGGKGHLWKIYLKIKIEESCHVYITLYCGFFVSSC